MRKSVILLFIFTLCCTCFATEYNFGQYNVRIITNDDTGAKAWENRKTYVTDLIKKYGFDVFSMNEVKATTQYGDIKSLLPNYSFYAHSVSSTTVVERETMNVVAWKTDKFDLLDKGRWFISADPLNTARLISDSRQSRNTVWVKLQDKVTKEIFYYFATHLDHVGWDARKEGAKINIDMVRKTAGNYPCVIGGDHNAGEGDIRVDIPLRSYFKSSGTECPPADGKKATFGSFNPEASVGGTPIDFLYSRNMNVLSYSIIRDAMGNPAGITPSDHYAIMSTMSLKPFAASTRQCVKSDVQKAIDAASAGDTICLTAGILEESIVVNKSLTIIGGYDDSFKDVIGRTVFDGSNGNFAHMITIEPYAYCELENINITGGKATTSGDNKGAGIYSKGIYLTLKNCDVHDNLATDKGGGIYAQYQLQAYDCKFYNNRASNDGGAFYANSSNTWRFTFQNCLFRENRATIGGAGYITGMVRGYFKGNSFLSNTARSSAGALYMGNKKEQALNLTFLNNTFADNVISETGGNDGSAIYAELFRDAELQSLSTTMNLVANTIVGNKGEKSAVTVTSGYLGLYNNIIGGNKGGDVTLNGDFVASENNVYTTSTSVEGITCGNTDLIGTDRQTALADLSVMFGTKVENDCVTPLPSKDDVPVLDVISPLYSGKTIVAVTSTWTTESKLKADLNDDTAVMTQKYTDDQRGKTRKTPYTIGAVEYDAASGIEGIIDNGQLTIDNSIYNLQGVKVSNIQHGQLYIRDGKKYIMK